MREILEGVIFGLCAFLAVFALAMALTGCEVTCSCGGKFFQGYGNSASCAEFCKQQPQQHAGYLNCRIVRGQLVCVA